MKMLYFISNVKNYPVLLVTLTYKTAQDFDKIHFCTNIDYEIFLCIEWLSLFCNTVEAA